MRTAIPIALWIVSLLGAMAIWKGADGLPIKQKAYIAGGALAFSLGNTLRVMYG